MKIEFDGAVSIEVPTDDELSEIYDTVKGTMQQEEALDLMREITLCHRLHNGLLDGRKRRFDVRSALLVAQHGKKLSVRRDDRAARKRWDLVVSCFLSSVSNAL